MNNYPQVTPIKSLTNNNSHLISTPPPNTEYLAKLQGEIDELEQQLCNLTFFIFIVENNNLPTIELLQSNTDRVTETTHRKNEKDDLYQIIMRERKDYSDLERVRNAQCEQFKQIQLKCKQLELDNNELKNNMYILEKEKMEQAERIKELQREVDRLRNEKVKQIQYKKDDLNQIFSQRDKNIVYYNTYK